MSYTLYGVEFSYYTGKLRAYLRYKQIPFVDKMATAWQYKRFIVPRTGAAYIPVLRTPQDEALQDTSTIIDIMEQRVAERCIWPQSPVQRVVASLLEVYGDEWMLFPALHYRWGYLDQQYDYLMEAFGSVVHPRLPKRLKRHFGKKLSARFRNGIVKLGITPITKPVIESRFHELLYTLNSHFADHDYLLGSRPCIGDFALAGPIGAHLCRDPVPAKIVAAKAPWVVRWIERIYSAQQPEGEFLPDDEIPETLLPLLQQLFEDMMPTLLDTVAVVQKWVADNPERKQLPRVVGELRFRICQVEESRAVQPYSQWMLQRPLDIYDALADDDQVAVDSFFHERGWMSPGELNLPVRLGKQDNMLIVSGR